MSTVNAAIPLSAGQGVTPMMTPFQGQQGALTIQNLIQQTQMNQQAIQQHQRTMKDQVMMAQLASDPANYDKETGGFTADALTKIDNPMLRQKLNDDRMNALKLISDLKYKTSEEGKMSDDRKTSAAKGVVDQGYEAYEANKDNPAVATQKMREAMSQGFDELASTGRGGFSKEEIAATRAKWLAATPDDVTRSVITHKERVEQENKDRTAKDAEETPFIKETNYLNSLKGKLADLKPGDPSSKPLLNQISMLEQHIKKLDDVSGGDKDKVPSGFRKSEDGNLEFIPGGPADPSRKEGKLGTREQVTLSRVMTSANEAARDLANVVQLPIDFSSGILGKLGKHETTSIFGAGKDALTNAMTSQEVQSYNVLSSGFQRSLAGIESSGLAPPASLSGQMDSVIFKQGDTQLTKLQKLAQTRQIIEAGLETQLSNPRIPEKELKHMEDVVASVKKAVPFTQTDLLEMQRRQEKNPETTLNDVIKENQKKMEKESPAVKSLQGNDAAAKIKADYQSGKLTREQARDQLSKLNQ